MLFAIVLDHIFFSILDYKRKFPKKYQDITFGTREFLAYKFSLAPPVSNTKHKPPADRNLIEIVVSSYLDEFQSHLDSLGFSWTIGPSSYQHFELMSVKVGKNLFVAKGQIQLN